MSNIDIQVKRDEYPSLQIGDIAYYCDPQTSAGFDVQQDNLVKIGRILSINNSTVLANGTETTTLTCEISSSTPPPVTDRSFIFFTKDNKVNLSSLLGYYASVRFKNNSPNAAELYTVASEISESSK
jgi:hypothetical protein|tara:strand:- start:482 stop:862 length:381 start_codon:yes stop_codon:yes gene_type:complete